MVNIAAVAAFAPEMASRLMRLLPREFQDAFVNSPNVFMFFMSMGLAAVLIAAFWMLTGMGKASRAARIALRAQALKRTKDHRALVLIAEIEGGGGELRQEMKEAIEDNFGMFSFEQNVQVDLFPVRLKTLPKATVRRDVLHRMRAIHTAFRKGNARDVARLVEQHVQAARGFFLSTPG